jgi:hypothetical protein
LDDPETVQRYEECKMVLNQNDPCHSMQFPWWD